MRTTASYDLFPDAPSERAMARARWLAREGRTADAESAYMSLLSSHPDLKVCWAEYFELLRASGRSAAALELAERARAQFGETGFALTLQGAALVELGRYPDALAALERAVEADPDLALDRAFALEPHTETLKLRGRVLRDAGRYQAAEVAFEGAAQAAEHPEQRADAEREIAATRRYAFYAPRKPDDLGPGERWFADTGAVVLAPDAGPVPPGDETLVATFAEVAEDSGWRFGQVIAVDPDLPVWSDLAERLGAPLAGPDAFDPATIPLVVAETADVADRTWTKLADAVQAEGAGLVFVLEHPAESGAGGAAGPDVIGVLTDDGQRRMRAPNPAHALSEAQHPGARLAGRRLSRPS